MHKLTMKSQFSRKVRKLTETFFSNQPNRGDTSPELRRAIEEYSVNLSYNKPKAPAAPPELEGYITKVARHAYKVTDEDIIQLKAAGYSEDELFELTISTALGAGRVRLEKGLAALNVVSDSKLQKVK